MHYRTFKSFGEEIINKIIKLKIFRVDSSFSTPFLTVKKNIISFLMENSDQKRNIDKNVLDFL